jgi:carbamoyltransferase
MFNILSIYGAHDSSVTFIDKEGKFRVFEYERFVKKRYAAFTKKYGSDEKSEVNRVNFIKYIKSMTHGEIDLILYNNLFDDDFTLLSSFFPKAKFELMGHHISHAASGYFTSNFDDAIILSVDGGGHDYGMVSFTNIFHAENNEINLLESRDFNIGVAYGRIGSPISEISPGGGDEIDSLAYAGKVMGLCAYGNIRNEWTESLKVFYKEEQNKILQSNLDFLGQNIKVNLNYNQLNGQDSFDLAATSQHVFENIMFELIEPYLEKSNNFIIVGGCGLNVLFNQKIKLFLNKLGKNFYVPPFPNDCGLSIGQFLYKTKEKINDFVYNGIGILDYDRLNHFIDIYKPKKINVPDIVNLIKNGKIIGLIKDNSEIGPRALGNRSIICDPTNKNMKDVLNKKVKFREWFRPFAPVCRDEDSEEIFDDVFESRYMSYAPKVKEKYRSLLPSITHNDGTGRLQTVNKKDHELFYDILTELKNRNLTPIILNTSFNIKGKPILTTIEDSLYVLENTELDYVIIDDLLFKKLLK